MLDGVGSGGNDAIHGWHSATSNWLRQQPEIVFLRMRVRNNALHLLNVPRRERVATLQQQEPG